MDQVLLAATEAANASREEFNLKSSGFVMVGGCWYGPDDIAVFGQDATAEFITEAPTHGERQDTLRRILGNPWLVGIAGAVIASGITAWLKWT